MHETTPIAMPEEIVANGTLLDASGALLTWGGARLVRSDRFVYGRAVALETRLRVRWFQLTTAAYDALHRTHDAEMGAHGAGARAVWVSTGYVALHTAVRSCAALTVYGLGPTREYCARHRTDAVAYSYYEAGAGSLCDVYARHEQRAMTPAGGHLFEREKDVFERVYRTHTSVSIVFKLNGCE